MEMLLLFVPLLEEFALTCLRIPASNSAKNGLVLSEYAGVPAPEKTMRPGEPEKSQIRWSKPKGEAAEEEVLGVVDDMVRKRAVGDGKSEADASSLRGR